MIQDTRVVEYDEHQDEYTVLADLPEDAGTEGVVNTNYGTYLETESLDFEALHPDMNFTYITGFARDGDRLYLFRQNSNDRNFVPTLHTFLVDGTFVESQTLPLPARPTDLQLRYRYNGLDVFDGKIYIIRDYPQRPPNPHYHTLYIIDEETLTVDDTFSVSDYCSNPIVDEDRIYILIDGVFTPMDHSMAISKRQRF